MRLLFSILLGLISFLSPAQDSTVCIKPSTARYYLEVEDEALILREKDSISNELIFSQSEQLLVKDQIIHTYQQDSVTFQNREASYTQHIDYVTSELTKAEREVKKQKTLKIIIIGLGVLGIFLL